ncbi:MAG: EutN/CcmL family microcompartment protein [Opitutales bacterium]
MLHARVVGHAHSTVHHPSLRGVRLLLCEGLEADASGNGKFFLAADWQGAGIGSRVMVTTDGGAASREVHDDSTPLRNVILGIIDETAEVAS